MDAPNETTITNSQNVLNSQKKYSQDHIKHLECISILKS